ncbi:urate oxidase [Natrialba chahannaoensis JCM 10990]|uniref:factor independent urate hydroxylase n=2 Tax=Natrialba chahannaoensis TaxID=68911 RepID=M0B3U5_9EURY|nr:urate oxidase [Natrialba chahannaoensis JCM 10990]
MLGEWYYATRGTIDWTETTRDRNRKPTNKYRNATETQDGKSDTMTTDKYGSSNSEDERTMNYGKEKIAVYRTYGTPLEGVRTIPESPFDGRDNTLFGLDVRVQLEGDEFLPSFRDGDNSKVVATDTMKNFVHHQLEEYDGATPEGFLHFAGSRFLEQYSQIEAVRMTANEVPFDERLVPSDDGDGFEPSELVYRVSDDESTFSEVYVEENGDGGTVISDQTSGVTELELVKVKGSSFTDYVQDEYTTLPEREDRTLYITLDIFWDYEDSHDSLGEEPERYVAAEQVRDIAQVVFHEVNSNSIQDLIYQIGLRVLERFPQLESVTFEANNRTWLQVSEEDGADSPRVLKEPPRPTGYQQFQMDSSDLGNE